MRTLDLLHPFGVVSVITASLFLPGCWEGGDDAPEMVFTKNSSGRPCRSSAGTSHIPKLSMGIAQTPIRNFLIYLGQIVLPMGCLRPSMHCSWWIVSLRY